MHWLLVRSSMVKFIPFYCIESEGVWGLSFRVQVINIFLLCIYLPTSRGSKSKTGTCVLSKAIKNCMGLDHLATLMSPAVTGNF